jgi:hypothetical protein
MKKSVDFVRIGLLIGVMCVLLVLAMGIFFIWQGHAKQRAANLRFDRILTEVEKTVLADVGFSHFYEHESCPSPESLRMALKLPFIAVLSSRYSRGGMHGWADSEYRPHDFRVFLTCLQLDGVAQSSESVHTVLYLDFIEDAGKNRLNCYVIAMDPKAQRHYLGTFVGGGTIGGRPGVGPGRGGGSSIPFSWKRVTEWIKKGLELPRNE